VLRDIPVTRVATNAALSALSDLAHFPPLDRCSIKLSDLPVAAGARDAAIRRGSPEPPHRSLNMLRQAGFAAA